MDKDTSTSATSSDEAEDSKPARKGSHPSAVDRYFHITEHDLTTVTEIRGGVVTFLAMAYIILPDPLIPDNIEDVNGNSLGIPQVTAITTLAAGAMTVAFGLFAKYPFSITTGLGINTLVVVTFAVNEGLVWEETMGLVVLDGVIAVLLALTGFRTAISHAIPSDMKVMMSTDIDLFIVMTSLVDGGLVHRIPDAADTTIPVQLDISGWIVSWPIVVSVLGLIICGIIVVHDVPGDLLIGIMLNIIIALVVEALTNADSSFADGKPVSTDWNLTIPTLPNRMGGMPDLSLVEAVDLLDSLARVGALSATVLLFTSILANFLDTMGTMTGLGKQAALVDEDGVLPDMKRALTVEGTDAIVGGAVSSSSNTVFVDSAANTTDGTHTGLANIVTGILFLTTMFLTPLYEIVPIEAATSVPVIVGVMMVRQITETDLTRFDIALPAFLTMITMPFTHSIANGIGIGLITFVVMAVFPGCARSVHPLMWIVSGLFIAYPAADPFTTLLGD